MTNYILDTNCFRDIHAASPLSGFNKWFHRQSLGNLYTTTMNVAEMWYGIENLPKGEKKASLEQWRDEYFLPNFGERILAFDLKAAKIHGVMRARNEVAGKPKPVADGIIAAIALANGFAVVTRNTRDFTGLGIEIVNPWH